MKKPGKKTQSTSTARRYFLKKAAKTAVLVPPAMLLLSRPSSAGMRASAGPQGGAPGDYGMTENKVAKREVAV